ncbi:hypothetical protein GCM10012275_19020 [Longimycelium tulufanense]|uniref:TauD/TfdA-like domain-containing protein n=1 Tax=Longimycelium tulufanense TaxID=907463 RepID=A0A8J3FTQ3_9PSEU|nr:TauD/TfdA family dioxygenase [Longimycelium tulufanense]GGM48168.1 hypothetical protein GCM10012275_19020 [Longimycelium tulufanense]
MTNFDLYRVDIRAGEGLAALVATLAEHGFALITGVSEADTLLRLARSLATIVPHRDSAANGITTIADLGTPGAGFLGFSSRELAPHTDRSSVDKPPGLLMMGCAQPAASGGQCVVVDGKAVYDDLAETAPDALHALSTPRSALFGGASGYLGSVFSRASSGRIAVRLRLDDLAQFSPEATRFLPILRDALSRHAMTYGLKTGEGYILHNHRWMHGRRAFLGQRVMYRINGNPLPHIDIHSGFTPFRRVLPSTAA